MSNNRIPPNNIEAEEAVLGSLIIDTEIVGDISEILKPDDFFREQNRWIYESILSLHEEREPIDLITLTDDLRKRDDRLGQMGGEAYVIGLINSVPTSINAESYARIVKECAARRKMISLASATANLAYDEEAPVARALDVVELAFRDMHDHAEESPVKDGTAMAGDYLDYLEKARDGGSGGLKTGYIEYDAFIGGLSSPFMHVLAARPGMGKSSAMAGVAEYVAIDSGMTVLFFSLEMTSAQVVQRIVARRTGINMHRLRVGSLSDVEWRKIHAVTDRVSRSGLFIDETPDLTPEQARTRSSRLADKHGLDLIIYDHLHLMRSTKYVGNPNKEVGDVSKQISYISKELGVPSILAAQLNRGVEDRKDKRPNLRDLRDSGEIEQNAYSVTFVYREDYYDPLESERRQLAELIVSKNRDGPLGTIELMWNPGTASFSNIIRQAIV